MFLCDVIGLVKGLRDDLVRKAGVIGGGVPASGVVGRNGITGMSSIISSDSGNNNPSLLHVKFTKKQRGKKNQTHAFTKHIL